MSAIDEVLVELQAEAQEQEGFIERIVQGARNENREVNKSEEDLITRHRKALESVSDKLSHFRETSRIASESREKTALIQADMRRRAEVSEQRPGMPSAVEYRSAGAYIADVYYAGLGAEDSINRLAVFNRAAAHQTTADNPGLIPEQIVTPLVNFIEVARPLIATVGPTDLGGGAWAYARVTQHTLVAKQAGEKTELASRKMLITKTPLGADTFGGYVNVSKQDINRSSPAILDMVINDLAQQYAIETEEEMGTVLTAAATVGPVIPATPTGANVATAIWGAAGSVFAATKGQGRTVVAVSPDQLGVIGPLFPNVNPTNAYSTGFPVGSIGQGEQGSISGLTVIMSAGLATDTILVYSTAAVKAFEYKYGNLQVVEPSVWGVQVGYAGDFDAVVIEPAGVVRVTTA